MQARNTDTTSSESSDLLWIFGYGSLIWKPPEGFQHVKKQAGFIQGFERRFWQGSTDHRGIPGAPGLVATLLSSERVQQGDKTGSVGLCWGMTYAYEGDQKEILRYLDFREKNGYERTTADVWTSHTAKAPCITGAVVYVATPDNYEYCGPLSNEECAVQIARSYGPSGSNAEYLFELADALRVIQAEDPHVFDIESRVRRLNPVLDHPGGRKAVSVFVGDGSHEGDGGWMLQQLWQSRQWVVVESGGVLRGVYTSSGGTPLEVLIQAGWPASMGIDPYAPAETFLKTLGHKRKLISAHSARFPDGGALLSLEYEDTDRGFLHYLFTETASKAWLQHTSA